MAGQKEGCSIKIDAQVARWLEEIRKLTEGIEGRRDGIKEAVAANFGRPDRYVCKVDADERRLAADKQRKSELLERIKSPLDAFDTPRKLFYQAYYCDAQKSAYAARIARISRRTASRYVREVREAKANAVDGNRQEHHAGRIPADADAL